MSARPFIDSLDFAKNGMELHGEVAVADLPRLADLLFSPEGSLGYYVSGHQDKNGVSTLEIALQGNCKLLCHRCLGNLDHSIELINQVTLVSASNFNPLEVEEGPDTIEASGHLDLIDFIEDELLLSLPFAPKHASEECQYATDGLERSETRFSALAELKQVI